MSFGFYSDVWDKICVEVCSNASLARYASIVSTFEILDIDNTNVIIFTNYYRMECFLSANKIDSFIAIVRMILDNKKICVTFQCEYIPCKKLEPTKTLNTFKVNSENRLALAVAENICSLPSSKKYSPLYIHSDTGLGKSHLVNAIAIEYKNSFPLKNIVRYTGESFIASFFKATKLNSLERWTEYNKSCDLFILDDIQFLIDNENIINEFYKIFDFLYNSESNPQVIITSNKKPNYLKGFPDSLKSRLQWGIKLEILSPNTNTKEYIITNILNQYDIYLSNNIKTYIARNFEGNIRELEGFIKTIYTHSALLKEDIDITLIDKVLGRENKSFEYSITGEDILYNVCKYFNISETDIKSKNRSRIIAFPRQIGMYITKKLTNLSLQEIGKIYGGRDHSTVKHSNDKIIRLYKTKDNTKIEINTIIKAIQNKKVYK